MLAKGEVSGVQTIDGMFVAIDPRWDTSVVEWRWGRDQEVNSQASSG